MSFAKGMWMLLGGDPTPPDASLTIRVAGGDFGDLSAEQKAAVKEAYLRFLYDSRLSVANNPTATYLTGDGQIRFVTVGIQTTAFVELDISKKNRPASQCPVVCRRIDARACSSSLNDCGVSVGIVIPRAFDPFSSASNPEVIR